MPSLRKKAERQARAKQAECARLSAVCEPLAMAAIEREDAKENAVKAPNGYLGTTWNGENVYVTQHKAASGRPGDWNAYAKQRNERLKKIEHSAGVKANEPNRTKRERFYGQETTPKTKK